MSQIALKWLILRSTEKCYTYPNKLMKQAIWLYDDQMSVLCLNYKFFVPGGWTNIPPGIASARHLATLSRRPVSPDWWRSVQFLSMSKIVFSINEVHLINWKTAKQFFPSSQSDLLHLLAPFQPFVVCDEMLRNVLIRRPDCRIHHKNIHRSAMAPMADKRSSSLELISFKRLHFLSDLLVLHS